ncbi:MAG TPA: hypothetical protein VFT74_18050 [Isosphaeraceae bacterium]|nr:hypothetical protein [Isosphaeraceae bacterium]
MSAVDTDELSEILDRVRNLSAASRITLARRVLETLEVSQPSRPESEASPQPSTRGWPVEKALGLLKTDRDPPNDEECRRIVEEERWKKYGA